MTFSVKEWLGGRPRENYTFQRGIRVWRYTSAETPQVEEGITFVPALIRRGPIKRDGDSGASKVEITIHRSAPLAQLFLAAHPEPVIVTLHRTQPGATSRALPLLGEVRGVDPQRSVVVVTVATIEAAFEREFPRVKQTKTCQNALYSERCGVDKAVWAHATTLTAVGISSNASLGHYVEVADLPLLTGDGYFNAGMLETGEGYPLWITKHEEQPGGEQRLYLFGVASTSMVVGSPVTIYPGCDKTPKMCHERFLNQRNFLGFPWIPDKDPTHRVD